MLRDKPIHTVEHTKITLLLAQLNGFKMPKMLSLGLTLLAIIGLAIASNRVLKIGFLGVIVAGLGMQYVATRLKFDETLFQHWQSLNIAELDHLLQQQNPQFVAGKTLEARILGTQTWIKRGGYCLFLQLILMLLLALFFVR